MKQLQDNFTTIEQSQKLLSLKVPRWSADCYLVDNREHDAWKKELDICVWRNDDDSGSKENREAMYNVAPVSLTPCWSTGRLIEICELCNISGKALIYDFLKTNTAKVMVSYIEDGLHFKLIDLSKLDEYEPK